MGKVSKKVKDTNELKEPFSGDYNPLVSYEWGVWGTGAWQHTSSDYITPSEFSRRLLDFVRIERQAPTSARAFVPFVEKFANNWKMDGVASLDRCFSQVVVCGYIKTVVGCRDLATAIRATVNKSMLKFHPGVGGIWVCHEPPTVLPQVNSHCAIGDVDHRYLKVQVVVFAFHPHFNSLLVGRIHRLSADYISLIVCETFAAVIPVSHMPAGLQFVQGKDADFFAYPQGGKKLALQNDIVFRVVRLLGGSRGLNSLIVGSLKDSQYTGPVETVKIELAMKSEGGGKKKRSKATSSQANEANEA
eukprot:Platyproteum_vivax@DN1010_c0_g1_i1.p1